MHGHTWTGPHAAVLSTSCRNKIIADAAKAAGIDQFVYLSVASELANGPAKFLLGDYLKGKAEAEVSCHA